MTERIKGEQQAARPAKVAASHFHWITFYWLPADGLDAKKFLGRSRQTSLGGPTACKSMEMTTFLWHVAWINGLKSWKCTRIVNCLAILFGIKNIGKKSYEKKYLKNHIQHISKQNKQHHTKNKIRTMMISPNIWWVFMYANPHKTKTTKPVIMVVIEKFDPLTPPDEARSSRWHHLHTTSTFETHTHQKNIIFPVIWCTLGIRNKTKWNKNSNIWKMSQDVCCFAARQCPLCQGKSSTARIQMDFHAHKRPWNKKDDDDRIWMRSDVLLPDEAPQCTFCTLQLTKWVFTLTGETKKRSY